MPHGLSPREQVAERAKRGNGGLHNDVNNFRSLMPFMTFENGSAERIVLYPLRLDMHTGLPALADQAEAQIIFDYLCDRNKQFGTVMTLHNGVIEVKLQ